ncbi:bifunctional methylenetetrahydrofolate dehydrogenase/methenyltetrahydrofolate cyclohydrolase [Gemella sp. GH3]|uniref:bifunctional 5,10-methylenetetrahydrofolate dehydrogenase/5,10-methenyltetrahydrofolate cyclohydrolase n=1 Tax=unclassified Gemella TaxID=2624949 RepID=UPI0015CFBFA6|nr:MULTISPECIES: tetrahydrofolate dehydrogenase/cyclohydrolase catalytic domain-containing protein [unclassified Gemella]MBF0713476.1 bifunctional methylenetetrahydrofolate dehydrogenase/methenyltetrahydrofolate cyclohydrolase [Gemella sp. GH3.1]NYS50428.1 bifunctional methylenetetrahydrofolate dehydrogenase/methenyltetrahydrofolate cyclohydrolase [Gemella sp. GH3]
MAHIIDGKKIALCTRNQIKKEAEEFKKLGINPTLSVVLVGDNRASKSYVNAKHKACLENGINSIKIELPENTTEEELLLEINKLNNDDSINGILIQLPLPKHINSDTVLEKISPIKDVDGFHPVNIGKLSVGKADLIPCTPLGILELIKSTNINIEGKNALVIGRSNIVGKPIANLLIHENATVTIAHSKTINLKNLIANSDIIVSCVGIAHFLGDNYSYKEDSLIIDVGNNYKNDKLVGDVDFDFVKEKVKYISPVPGGVGPMTITMLMRNTLTALRKQIK